MVFYKMHNDVNNGFPEFCYTKHGNHISKNW